MTSPIRIGARFPAVVGGIVLGLLAPTLFARGASAATTPTTTKAPSGAVQNFCAQVRASQTSIASATGTAAEKNKRIGLEWGKIEKVSPASIKSQVTIIKAAYTKASTESEVAATATLAGIASAGQKVTAFVSTSCTAGGGAGAGGANGPGDGGPGRLDPTRLAEIKACFEKEGVTFPDLGTPGAGRPANATPGTGSRPAGGTPNVQDPKFQAAAQKCGFGGGFGGGGAGGPGGFGGRGMSDAVRKCVAAKGITLPTPGQGGAGTATPTTKKGATAVSAPQAGAGGGRVQFDDKTRAAIQACRAANPN